MSENEVVRAALPYTLEFDRLSPQSESPLPKLQSYSVAPCEPAAWLVVGGRFDQGLHKFTTRGVSFIPQDANPYLWLIMPESHAAIPLLDIVKLPQEMADPLLGTDQLSWYDVRAGHWYIAGGYSLTGDPSVSLKMKTYDTLFRIPAREILNIFRQGGSQVERTQEAIANTLEYTHDPLFQLTGGMLTRLPDATFVLLGGQMFDGLYDPFGGGFNQVYSNQVRYFRLRPNSLALLESGFISHEGTDQPLHRRDGNFIETVNPVTGLARAAMFGGVFPPGRLAGYSNPVYTSSEGTPLSLVVDRRGIQLFNSYSCPAIVVYDENMRTVYHTFFGGIGHYFYHQNPEQQEVYRAVTKVGRNDGLPFVCDIATFLERAEGDYEEFIAPDPIPGYSLHGTSASFIPNVALSHGHFRDNGVLNLHAFSKRSRTLIGYIFGGIEASFPLPLIPNTGTSASNVLYRVFLHHIPWNGIPASQGREATGITANIAVRA